MEKIHRLSVRLNWKLVGRRLVKIRHVLGFGQHGGQQRFCNEYGFDRNSWSSYETGTHLIPVGVAVRLMEIKTLAGLSLDWIYLGRFMDVPADLRRLLTGGSALVETPELEDE